MYFKCGTDSVRWMVFFGLFIRTLEHEHCKGKCGETMITAFLDSTVILPCSFDNSTTGPVLWSVEATSITSPSKQLVQINSTHKVSFMEHKTGRLVVFPNLSEIGNFSIRIDQFKPADVGTYCCVRAENKCTRVEVKQGQPASDKPKEEEQRGRGLSKGNYVIIAITVPLIAVILTLFCILMNKRIHVNSIEYYINRTNNKGNIPARAQPSAPPHPHDQPATQTHSRQERGDSENSLHECYPVRQNNLHQGGGDIIIPRRGFSYFNNHTQRAEVMVHRRDNVVYENAEHDPDHQQLGTRLQVHFERDIRNSPRNRISRVDQPNYANQSEINNVEKSVIEVQRRGQNYEFQNPIYGNSIECLIQDDG